MPVIKGTRQAKANIVKTQHKSGFSKLRCSACKIGIAVEVETVQGKVYRCNRCGREFAAEKSM
jgi:hypothetical protein